MRFKSLECVWIINLCGRGENRRHCHWTECASRLCIPLVPAGVAISPLRLCCSWSTWTETYQLRFVYSVFRGFMFQQSTLGFVFVFRCFNHIKSLFMFGLINIQLDVCVHWNASCNFLLQTNNNDIWGIWEHPCVFLDSWKPKTFWAPNNLDSNGL